MAFEQVARTELVEVGNYIRPYKTQTGHTVDEDGTNRIVLRVKDRESDREAVIGFRLEDVEDIAEMLVRAKRVAEEMAFRLPEGPEGLN